MTDNFPANAGIKLLRSFLALIDWGVYTLLGFMYEIFFNVASADLFSNEMVLGFYKRVQLIIGVYMVFQLAVLIMKGIFNTDNVSGKNTNDFVKRIIIALVMLTVMTPISIPSPQNKYEIQINNNGLLFGTLYSLQYRILSNNTIGRLVLGTNDSTSTGTSNSTSNKNGSGWYSGAYGKSSKVDDLTKSANIFTTTMLKGFIRINLVEPDKRKPVAEGKALETLNANRMCKDIDDDTLKIYVANDTPPGDLLSLVNATCTPDTNVLTGGIYSALSFFGLSGKTKFVFAYMPIVSTVVGIVFVVIMISFTIDIAVRAIKLAVLRLIAPIPIISYMDPNGSKDSGFNSWVKTLTQTYLDLFIRLASVYFVIYLIQDMIANGIYMNFTTDAVGIISFVFICIGLFLFAKEAPKFLQQAIGMKSEPVNVFGSALATGGAIAGMVGSARTNYRTAKEENEAIRPNDSLNGLRNVGSAIAGAIAGGGVGIAAAKGKDASLKKVLDAQSARNATRASHSTLPGRIADSVYGTFTGRSLATQGNNVLKGAQDWVKAQGDWKKALEEEAMKNGAATDLGGGIVGRFEELQRAVASAHDGVVTFNGTDYDSNMFTTSYMDDALKAQVRSYQGYTDATGYHAGTEKAGGTSYATNIQAGQKLYKKREDVERTRKDVNVAGLEPAVAQNFNDYDVDRVDTFGKAIGAANNVISNQENDMRQRMRRANNQQKGK